MWPIKYQILFLFQVFFFNSNYNHFAVLVLTIFIFLNPLGNVDFGQFHVHSRFRVSFALYQLCFSAGNNSRQRGRDFMVRAPPLAIATLRYTLIFVREQSVSGWYFERKLFAFQALISVIFKSLLKNSSNKPGSQSESERAFAQSCARRRRRILLFFDAGPERNQYYCEARKM